MSSQYTLKIAADKAKEIPMVDLAFELLKAANTPFYYRDLMAEIAKIKGLTDDEVMEVIAHLYTEINIDGRFACVGSNLWGLKRWYPVDKSDDTAVGGAKRPRIINDDDDDEDEDIFPEEEETYAEEEDDEFDGFDKVRDEDDFDESEEELEEEETEFFDEDEDSGDVDAEDSDLDEEDSDSDEEDESGDDDFDNDK